MTHEVRRTKIVATLGPSWAKPDQLRDLLEAGVDVVRINASHGTPETRSEWIRMVRGVQANQRSASAVLVDLHGPRIRVGALGAPLTLEAGQRVVFAPQGTAEPGEIPTTYPELSHDVQRGRTILLDDGLLSASVLETTGDRVVAEIRHGGILRPNKGMNLPGVSVSAPAVTPKDEEEVARAVAAGVDFIGLSFVRRVEDIQCLRALLPRDSKIRVVAKIEKDTALENLEDILEAADAIMVARGDLGVELPYEQVPLVQKRLIREASLHGKPVITATQMLESMVQAPRPTRAEASDVANAILDGTDALMLSAETAVGAYPKEAVLAMDRIAREIESHRREGDPDAASWSVVGLHHQQQHRETKTEDAIAVAVCAAAELLQAPLIVCFTSSGFTARTVASYRPEVPILAVTPEPETYRQLSLVWGVVPVLVDHAPNYESMLPLARAGISDRGLAQAGDRVVVTAGVPFDVAGTTNLLKIETV